MIFYQGILDNEILQLATDKACQQLALHLSLVGRFRQLERRAQQVTGNLDPREISGLRPACTGCRELLVSKSSRDPRMHGTVADDEQGGESIWI